jgi:20S proteasome subunit beta 7
LGPSRKLPSPEEKLPTDHPKPRDDIYGTYDPSYLHTDGPKQHTQDPIVIGGSVIAMKFKDGVVIAADNLG